MAGRTFSAGLPTTPDAMQGSLLGIADGHFIRFQFFEIAFRRGDVNGDGAFDISDPVALLGALFAGAGPLVCADAADSNDDGANDVADAISLLNALFVPGSPPPPAPGPAVCGTDPTVDALGCGATICP
jgi:hypothetical protein